MALLLPFLVLILTATSALPTATLSDNAEVREVVRPPMGWRTWNSLGDNVDQNIFVAQMRALVERRNLVNGVPTSLRDLGYTSAGLDDGWTLCINHTFHDASGKPMVNGKFPSLKQMTAQGHALNLSVGWYMNPCGCNEGSLPPHYKEDAEATADFGFDELKVDSCGPASNMTAWRQELDTATSRVIKVENCRNYEDVPAIYEGVCPFTMFRSTEDNAPDWLSVMGNLQTNLREPGSGGDPHGGLPVSHPGCWSYPDMLEVGAGKCSQELPPGTCGRASTERRVGGLSLNESQAHFGAWAIVSSPLILGHNLTDTAIADAVWPVISNTEVIAVNQAWAGDLGRFIASSPGLMTNLTTYHGSNCECVVEGQTLPVWSVYAKKLVADGSLVAAIAINISNNTLAAGEIVIPMANISHVHGSHRWAQRDLWAHSEIDDITGADWTVPSLAPRSSFFAILTLVE